MRILLYIFIILKSNLSFGQHYFSDTTTNASFGSLYAGLALENDSTFYTLGIYDGYDSTLKVQLMVSKHSNNQITADALIFSETL